MAQPLIPDRWKYIIAHDRGGNFDGTGKRAYHTEVGPRGQVWARDPNQQAPHAYNANREAFGVSATGQVGQMPGQQQLTSLKKYYEGSQAQDRERFGKGREWIGHGHAYERSKGQRNQASKDGRSTNEAAWLGAVTSNGSGTPGNPVQPWHNASGMEGMIDGGELSAANWTGAKGAAANPPLASPPRTLVASHTAGAAGIPSVSGPTPIQEHPQMERKRQGGFGNFANQLLNPMTMAGLSILSDGNVGKGFSQLQNARQQQSLMDFRNEEAERAQGNRDRSFSATASHRKAMRAFQEQQAKIKSGRPWWAKDDGSIDPAMEAYRTSGKHGAATRFGLNPIAVQKPDGSIGYVVPNTAGGVKALELPGGSTAISPASTYQTPTETVTRDKFGKIIRREQKDIAGAARQGVLGTDQGKARIKLPMVENEVKRTIKYLDDLLDHPKFSAMTAPLSEYAPNVTAGSRDFAERLKQVQGKAFVTAFERLKGAGAVTETEGAKAGAALARIQSAEVGSENFADAVQDFKNELRALREIIRMKAKGMTPGMSQPQANQAEPSGSNAGWSIQKVN